MKNNIVVWFWKLILELLVKIQERTKDLRYCDFMNVFKLEDVIANKIWLVTLVAAKT